MKLIIIGCPGSGKSTLSFKLEEILCCPVLHLDKIYHIDNERRISREELCQKVDEFASSSENWIIDGNYVSTVEQRVKLADTILLLDLPKKTCLKNIVDRSKKEKTRDMADGFDNSILREEFVEFVEKFKKDTLPKIMEILKKYPQKDVMILKSYRQIDDYIRDCQEKYS